MMRLVILSFLTVTAIGFGVERPVLPGAEEDTALFGGLSAKEFFAARAAQTDCRARLRAAQDEWKSSAAADAKARWLALVEECGDCVTHPVEKRVIPTGGRTEVWYITDGSCRAEGDFAKARDSLRDVPLYAKKTNGFDHLLEFLPIDITTGQWQPEVKRLETFPVHVFAALRGIELFGLLTTYTQVFRVTWEDTSLKGSPMTIVRLDGEKAPRGFTAPEVYDVRPDGSKNVASQLRIPKVMAAWYLSESGYARYYSAGDFGISTKAAETEGRRMELETLLQFTDRWR